MGGYLADDGLGLDGRYSPAVQRYACYCAGQLSFQPASKMIRELLGLSISDESIRQLTYRVSSDMERFRDQAPEVGQDFREAAGDVEFQTDATKVNTTEGWKDAKIGLFLKRSCGPSATADEFGERRLPAPNARLSFARIESSDEFGPKWRIWAGRLGVEDTSQMSVLADGAPWIWEQVKIQFPGATEVLDIYHASEHIAATARVLHGEGTEAMKTWWEQGRRRVLEKGWPGLCEQVGETLEGEVTSEQRESLEELTRYFAGQCGRLNYASRLAEGRSIGSGAIEGACKQLIGKRLKQTGAKWRLANVNKLAEVRCLLEETNAWDAYWAGR